MLDHLNTAWLVEQFSLGDSHHICNKIFNFTFTLSLPSPSSAWKSHTGYYNCSMYEEKDENQEVNKARKALEKYLFYYQRVRERGEGGQGEHFETLLKQTFDTDFFHCINSLLLSLSLSSYQWANHGQSLCLEESTKKKIYDKIKEKVSEGYGTWIDWQYLHDAVALLRKVERASYY